mmetsp:Transcript_23183/g.28742  ORF Transcript_23183/g.28742 Transcript_23183/m.28742 type:complete len:156 (-) Transcript_23183:1209-1676(-)
MQANAYRYGGPARSLSANSQAGSSLMNIKNNNNVYGPGATNPNVMYMQNQQTYSPISSSSQNAYPNMQRPSGSSLDSRSQRHWRDSSPSKHGAMPRFNAGGRSNNQEDENMDNAIAMHSGNSQIISGRSHEFNNSSVQLSMKHDMPSVSKDPGAS